MFGFMQAGQTHFWAMRGFVAASSASGQSENCRVILAPQWAQLTCSLAASRRPPGFEWRFGLESGLAKGRTMKKRFTEAQIVGFLREADAGVPIKDLCRKHGFSDASYYLWLSKFGGMNVSDAKRLKELERENEGLRKAVSHLTLEKLILREAASGNF